MQKLPLRRLRLVGYSTQQLDNAQIEEHNDHVEHKTNTRGLTTSAPLLDTIQQSSPDAAIAEAESEARLLLKRTPGSYLLNQAYGLWVFGSLFLMTVIITRKLSVAEYGVYAVA